MKKFPFKLLFAASLTTIFLTSCQKSKNEDKLVLTQQTITHADDQNRFSSEIDAVANDAALALESTLSFSGRGEEIQGIICDATAVVDTTVNPRTITITYNGTNCNGTRTRTGTVVLTAAAGVRWKNAGAQISVSFQNLKITRVADNKSITLNGNQTYTNVSGGLLIQLASIQSITHAITSSGLTITFDDNTQRTWQVAKERVFTYQNGLVINIHGTHTAGGVSNIADWGTNRFGTGFTTAITEPVVLKQDCSFRVAAGKLKHTVAGITTDAVFGLNAQGNPTGCPGAAAYYMKLTLTGPAGNSISGLYPY